MELFLKITLAAVMIMLLFRLWPAAREWMQNGPKGTGDDWRSAILALAAVIGFVVLLIMMVRN
jgi:cytochrome b561